MHTIHRDIKNLKYVKSIKMYKKLTQIHLNYKFKKITFKNFQIHGLSDCLAKGVIILDGMVKTDRSPALKSGITRAIFIWSGAMP